MTLRAVETTIHDQAASVRAMATGLRGLALWIEEHHEYVERMGPIRAGIICYSEQEFRETSRALGSIDHHAFGSWLSVDRSFGGSVVASALIERKRA